MPLEGEGKYFQTRRGGKIVPTIYISVKVAQDSAFPFRSKDKLHVRIEGEKLIITKEKEK